MLTRRQRGSDGHSGEVRHVHHDPVHHGRHGHRRCQQCGHQSTWCGCWRCRRCGRGKLCEAPRLACLALKKYPPSAIFGWGELRSSIARAEGNCTHLPRYHLVRDGGRRSLGRLGPRGGRCACRCERESCPRPSQVAQAPCRSPHHECFLNDTSVSFPFPSL